MKSVKYLLTLAALCVVFSTATAQLTTRYYYVGVGVGATNYKGDLDDNFALKFTKPGLGFIGGYKFHPHMSVKLMLAQGWMKASDAKAILDGAPSPVPAEQSLQVITLLDAVYRSQREGAEIRL